MALLEIKNLSFSYAGREEMALDNVSLTVGRGEFALLMGESGYGKSTLLRQIKPILAPAGRLTGEILFDGAPVSDLSAEVQASRIGFVAQDPDSQIVTDKVWHELAFGLESLGADPGFIRRRVAEMSSFFGIDDWFRKDVSTLSGGQKQLLNLASVLTLSPDLLVLDEPTAMLDPIAASEFVNVLVRVNRELGVAVLLVEHRMDEILPVCDAVHVLTRGKIAFSGDPHSLGEWMGNTAHPLTLALPTPMRVFASLHAGGKSPVSVRDGREFLAEYAAVHSHGRVPERVSVRTPGDAVLSLRDVAFSYGRHFQPVLRNVSLSVRPGELLAILGGNGAGKTTAMKILAGAEKPLRGQRIAKDGVRIAMLPQNPKTLFAHDTVLEELREMDPAPARVQEIAQLCGISHLLSRHPYDLSGGEEEKAALAKILMKKTDVLLLDEPTKSMDAAFKRQFAGILASLLADGVAIAFVTHDIEFAAEHADRCVMLFDGEIAAAAPPREFFTSNNFYTTQACRMAKGIIDGAITPDEIVSAFQNHAPAPEDAPPPPVRHIPTEKPGKKKPDAARIAYIASPCAIALTLTAFALTGSKNYYLFALLLLIEVALPFFFRFEARRLHARELVLIATICGIGIAGRAVFFSLPSIKPMLAVAIVAGISLGGETGCMTGAITMFVSNFFFGQGPWTPWQMFAAGLIGLLSGILFHRRAGNPPIFLISLFGAFSALVIYGGIMNPVSVLTFSQNSTFEMLLMSFATGFTLDAVHALSTFLFLLLLGRPFMQKLDRVKTKYNLTPSRL